MEVLILNKELKVAILLQAIYLILDRFFNVPDFIMGLLLGVGLCFVVIGILPRKSHSTIKQFKNSLTKKT